MHTLVNCFFFPPTCICFTWGKIGFILSLHISDQEFESYMYAFQSWIILCTLYFYSMLKIHVSISRYIVQQRSKIKVEAYNFKKNIEWNIPENIARTRIILHESKTSEIYMVLVSAIFLVFHENQGHSVLYLLHIYRALHVFST